MAKTVKPASFRNGLSSDLLLFVDVLKKNTVGVCINPDVLKDTARMCKTNIPYGNGSWGYEVDRLLFRIKSPQKTHPSPNSGYLNLRLGFKINGMCDGDLSQLIKLLELNIVVENDEGTHLSSWHFDRHIVNEGDNSPEDAHPLYHFQYGGRNFSEIKEELGRVLLLPSPRIGHPPMDIILAVDFVLSNFCGIVWRGLRDNNEYKSKVVSAQERYWRPYMESIFSWWGVGKRANQEYLESLWPHLI